MVTPTHSTSPAPFATPADNQPLGTVHAPSPASFAVSPVYAWTVFTLTFALLLADFMSRQVLISVFPFLKAQWLLSDTQLGTLSSVVSIMVGLLTFPLSLLADRYGRVRSLIAMAILWSLATLGCAVSASYGDMLVARFFVGVGEAAYGSVGLAVVISVFPARWRATLSGAFLAGGAFGSTLGMALSGFIAARFGWRWSFTTMAIVGLVLAALYRLCVTEREIPLAECAPRRIREPRASLRSSVQKLRGALFASKSVVFAYVGSGIQLAVPGALATWLPSYLTRNFGMRVDGAGMLAAVFVLASGIGLIVCGMLTDHASRRVPHRKFTTMIVLSIVSFASLSVAFQLPPGPAQLALIGIGMFVSAGACASTGAVVANLTAPAFHATAMALWALANNLLGLASGPIVAGVLADRFDLRTALQIVPFAALAAALLFAVGSRYYRSDLDRATTSRDHSSN